MWKWLLGAFVAAVLVCGVGGYVVSRTDAAKGVLEKFRGGEKPLEVRSQVVGRGNLTRTVSAPGVIDPRTKVEISARVSAKILALPFKEGQDVKAGDVLVRLDAEDLQASLDAARAQLRGDEARLEGAQATLARMRSELERTRSLVSSKDRTPAELEVAEAEYLQAQSGLNGAQASIEMSRANVRRAERDLEYTVITAPIDGRIIKVNNEVGEMVLGTFNNIGQVIMELADPRVILMRAEVDEANIEPVKPGQKATVFVNAYPDRKFTGIVERLREQAQLAKDGKQYFEAEVVIELKEPGDADRLKSGLKANCDIEVETIYEVMKVPSQAVLDRRVEELPPEAARSPIVTARNKAFAQVVYRVVEGKTVVTPVETGSSDLQSTVILAGVETGARVVVGPYKVLAGLKDAQAVKELGEEQKGEGTAGGEKAGDGVTVRVRG